MNRKEIEDAMDTILTDLDAWDVVRDNYANEVNRLRKQLNETEVLLHQAEFKMFTLNLDYDQFSVMLKNLETTGETA